MARHTTIIMPVPVLVQPYSPIWYTLYGGHLKHQRKRYGSLVDVARGDLMHGYVERREHATIIWREADA